MVWWVKGEVHDFYKTPWFGGLKGKFMIFQNSMVCRVRGAESNGEGPRFVR